MKKLLQIPADAICEIKDQKTITDLKDYIRIVRSNNSVEKDKYYLVQFPAGADTMLSSVNGGDKESQEYKAHPYTIYVEYKLDGTNNYPANIWIEYTKGEPAYSTQSFKVSNFAHKEKVKAELQTRVKNYQDGKIDHQFEQLQDAVSVKLKTLWVFDKTVIAQSKINTEFYNRAAEIYILQNYSKYGLDINNYEKNIRYITEKDVNGNVIENQDKAFKIYSLKFLDKLCAAGLLKEEECKQYRAFIPDQNVIYKTLLEDEGIKKLKTVYAPNLGFVDGIFDAIWDYAESKVEDYNPMTYINMINTVKNGIMKFVTGETTFANEFSKLNQTSEKVADFLACLPYFLSNMSEYDSNYYKAYIGSQLVISVIDTKSYAKSGVYDFKMLRGAYLDSFERIFKIEEISKKLYAIIENKGLQYLLKLINKSKDEYNELDKIALLRIKDAKGIIHLQEHHFLSDKHLGQFTKKYKDEIEKFGLNLNESWNKAFIANHSGRHPEKYHIQMIEAISKIADNSTTAEEFKAKFNVLKIKIAEYPEQWLVD